MNTTEQLIEKYEEYIKFLRQKIDLPEIIEESKSIRKFQSELSQLKSDLEKEKGQEVSAEEIFEKHYLSDNSGRSMRQRMLDAMHEFRNAGRNDIESDNRIIELICDKIINYTGEGKFSSEKLQTIADIYRKNAGRDWEKIEKRFIDFCLRDPSISEIFNWFKQH